MRSAKSTNPVRHFIPSAAGRPPAQPDGRQASAKSERPLALNGPESHELLTGPAREELIRVRAYQRYLTNGCVDGTALDDWLNAEAEVCGLTASMTAAP